MPVLEALIIKGALVLAKTAAGKVLAYKAATAAAAGVANASSIGGAAAAVGGVGMGVAKTTAVVGKVAWTAETADKAVKVASDLRAGNTSNAIKGAAGIAWSLKDGGATSSITDTAGALVSGSGNAMTVVKAADGCRSIAKEAGKLKGGRS